MRIVSAFLAQNLLPTDVITNPWHWMGLSLKELLALLGAVALVTALLVIWAVYFRKSPRRHSHSRYRDSHHRHSHEPSNSSLGSQEEADSEASNDKRYRRKRRRRREHRPRNPTLAETGGLPPIRAERPPDSLP